MADNKSFLERLSEKIAPPSKELNMNADRVGLASLRAEPYASGISAEDAYKLAQINEVQNINAKREYDQAAAENYVKSRQYVNDKREADKYGGEVGPDGRYSLVTPEQILAANAEWAWDGPAGSTSNDPISIGLRKLEQYLVNKPRESANKYMNNVDPGLAAKWMADRESFR